MRHFVPAALARAEYTFDAVPYGVLRNRDLPVSAFFVARPPAAWRVGRGAVPRAWFPRGKTIFVADAHRGDEKRCVVRADEKLRAFLNEHPAKPAKPLPLSWAVSRG